MTWITSFRFSLTVSKRVNSSKADAHDATLIERVGIGCRVARPTHILSNT